MSMRTGAPTGTEEPAPGGTDAAGATAPTDSRATGAGAAIEVLAEPTRRRILDLLRDGELPVGDLVERLRMTQPAVSKHLRALRDAGLVEVRRDAQRRLYRIRPEPLAALDAWLAPYRALWGASLDRLARLLEDPEERTEP